ncbi:MAG: hypothetical protein L0I76_17010 [Pseudonocardia sp.]|nr:hypothetical protein [Pseudonocardia sp.]
MGRALLWWPFTAFLLVAAFPAVAVPAMVGSGLFLIVVGLVGGALGRRWRAHLLRRAGRTIGAVPPAVAETSTTAPATARTEGVARTEGAAWAEAAMSRESMSGEPTDKPSGDEPDDEGPDVRAA